MSTLGQKFPTRMLLGGGIIFGITFLIVLFLVVSQGRSLTPVFLAAAICGGAFLLYLILVLSLNNYAVIDWSNQTITMKRGVVYPFSEFTTLKGAYARGAYSLRFGVPSGEGFWVSNRIFIGNSKDDLALIAFLAPLLPNYNPEEMRNLLDKNSLLGRPF